ncbi:unnamed protein product [Thlaspi arvense]|uniref:Transcription repressor n=1 Tax=Thlaspi arvense TaxID=13288 RepID=A0AAU9SYB7_THLAR|nr:unnamed protein product [Thlaspi arvense]
MTKTKSPRVHSHRTKSYACSASPIFPPNPFYEESRSFRDLRKKIKTKRKQRTQFGSDSLLASRFKSSGSWCWSCSEEDESDDTDTLFSSRSFSSDSSKAESFAVVKKSEDPYEDFRTSMVEMIVERQIFAAAELQKLLQCFLSLNSLQHHSVIVQRPNLALVFGSANTRENNKTEESVDSSTTNLICIHSLISVFNYP